MKEILFVTGNSHKVWQANDILKPFNISVVAKDLPLTEIQSPDPKEIARAKARAAYALGQQALVVCDHSWSFPALNGFPGGYMKDMNHWFEPEDFLALLRDKADRSAILTENIIYIDGSEEREFTTEIHGTVTDEPRGVGYVACERIVAWEGSDRTIAEHIDAHEHARYTDRSAWIKFGAWYAGH